MKSHRSSLILRIFAAIALFALLVFPLSFGLATLSENYGGPVAALAFVALLTLGLPKATARCYAAADADRNTDQRPSDEIEIPVAAATIIYLGTLVARDANGRAVPASDTAGLRVIGRAEEQADNSDGDAGDINVKIRLGCFKFANSADNAIDADDLGKMAVVEDDQTVAETSTNLVCAGRIMGIDADDDGVWIDTRHAFFGPRTMPTLTSTNGVAAAAAADLAALAAEAEKSGDDTRALHSSFFG